LGAKVTVYRLLNEVLILVHFLWILFILLGFLVSFKSFKLSLIHVAGLIFTLILNLGGWYCPLTYLENHLRGSYDPQLTYTGSFIINRLQQVIYLDLDEAYLRVGAVVWVAVNMVGYALLAKKKFLEHSRPQGADKPEPGNKRRDRK
jgi:ABC-type multidrug transport system permease subunit